MSVEKVLRYRLLPIAVVSCIRPGENFQYILDPATPGIDITVSVASSPVKTVSCITAEAQTIEAHGVFL